MLIKALFRNENEYHKEKNIIFSLLFPWMLIFHGDGICLHNKSYHCPKCMGSPRIFHSIKLNIALWTRIILLHTYFIFYKLSNPVPFTVLKLLFYFETIIFYMLLKLLFHARTLNCVIFSRNIMMILIICR